MNAFRLTGAILAAVIFILSSCKESDSSLEHELLEYVADKDACIGIAVIIDGKDTVTVNGNEQFPMLSVFKFPQALAVADYCERNDLSLHDTIFIPRAEIHENTWSPLRDRYGVRDLYLPIDTLLSYSLRESDNNACDILFHLIGGPTAVQRYLDSIGAGGITVRFTEDDMHRDVMTCYGNSASPLEMVRLIDKFDVDFRDRNNSIKFIAAMMESCETGNDRLKAPLMKTDAFIGHKTGTGDLNNDGKIIGINDVGYVHLSNGTRYAIAVFISDSSYSLAETSSMIAAISAIVQRYLDKDNH